MNKILKRHSGKSDPLSLFEASNLLKTPTPKTITNIRPLTHPLITDLDITNRARESMDIYKTADAGFPLRTNPELTRKCHRTGKHFKELDISCEDIKGEELLSRRREKEKSTSKGILLGNKRKSKGRRSKPKQSKKKRRIHSLKETKDLDNEWEIKKQKGILRRLGTASRTKHKGKPISKTQFYSQSRKSRSGSNIFRLSPKNGTGHNSTKTSLYSDVPSGRNFWSRTHKLTKHIQFELLKNKAKKRKKPKGDYLTLRMGQVQKPFDVRYSITSKNKGKDVLMAFDRRHFNSVDWLPEQLAKLGRHSHMGLFFKKKSKRELKTDNSNKENLRMGSRKNKRNQKKKLNVDLYGAKVVKKKKSKGELFGEKPITKEDKKEKRVVGKKEGKKKQKVYCSLTEILRRESLNERLSLKGMDSDYFDNIYQKLSSKLNTKKRGKRKNINLSKNRKKAFKSNT
jgi:hypothetical protein